MKFLFVHQNFPGQFKHLAPALVREGHEVTAFTIKTNQPYEWQGVNVVPYGLARGNTAGVHPWSVDFESKMIRAEACMQMAIKLRDSGYTPDTVIAHPGWGESLCLKEVWPSAQLKVYCEFYYHTEGYDVGFDPEFQSPSITERARVRLRNANILTQFQDVDAGISPTHWQASTFPKHIREKITVVHDGIDTTLLCPNENASLTLATGETLTRKDQVITFVNRSLEPYRGYHQFMRALPEILKAQPHTRALIVGDDSNGYGAKHPSGKTWKQIFIEEVRHEFTDEDWSRVHFLGQIPYAQFVSLLQISTVHVYLTYPFVLSWSLLEAMSVGCAIVASDTQPLHEAIIDTETGLFVDFFDHTKLSNTVVSLMNDKELRNRLGANARRNAIANFDLNTKCLPIQIEWATNKVLS